MARFSQLKDVAGWPFAAGADLLIRAIEASSSVKRRFCGLAFAVKLERAPSVCPDYLGHASATGCDLSRKAAPTSRPGPCDAASVCAAAVGAGPDQRVTFAVFVIEEVGVDRSVEARIVELEAQIVAALVGALGPGGADFGVMWCTT